MTDLVFDHLQIRLQLREFVAHAFAVLDEQRQPRAHRLVAAGPQGGERLHPRNRHPGCLETHHETGDIKPACP